MLHREPCTAHTPRSTRTLPHTPWCTRLAPRSAHAHAMATHTAHSRNTSHSTSGCIFPLLPLGTAMARTVRNSHWAQTTRKHPDRPQCTLGHPTLDFRLGFGDTADSLVPFCAPTSPYSTWSDSGPPDTSHRTPHTYCHFGSSPRRSAPCTVLLPHTPHLSPTPHTPPARTECIPSRFSPNSHGTIPPKRTLAQCSRRTSPPAPTLPKSATR